MKTSSAKLYGDIEAGGTKFICAVGKIPTDLLTQRIQTTTPQKTLGEVIKFFKPYTSEEAYRRMLAIGIASFGPLDLNRESQRYGYIRRHPNQAGPIST
jgi:fructokinase